MPIPFLALFQPPAIRTHHSLCRQSVRGILLDSPGVGDAVFTRERMTPGVWHIKRIGHRNTNLPPVRLARYYACVTCRACFRYAANPDEAVSSVMIRIVANPGRGNRYGISSRLQVAQVHQTIAPGITTGAISFLNCTASDFSP